MRRLRTIAVAGGGTVAMLAALSFARALPGTRVTLLPQPVPADALADRLPLALPANLSLLSGLGIDLDALVRAGAGTERLATRFSDWPSTAGNWLVGEGDALAHPGLPLHQLWLRAASGGAMPPFHALIPACAAALAGGAVPDAPSPSPLARIGRALHLDAGRLMPGLLGMARRAGVAIASGDTTVAALERGPAGIAAVLLASRERVAADLFVDATGSARRLADALGPEQEDWAAMLPATRLLLASEATGAGAIDDHRALPFGWSARWPWGQAMGFAIAGDEEAARRALGPAGARAELIAIRPGRLVRGWTGNLLALGEAGVQPGPLGLLGLPIALGQLALALELLPDRDMEPLLIAEYNRRAGLHADRLRDFAVAHHHGAALAGPFWERARSAALPDSVADRLAQFARRGLLPPAPEDSVTRDAWIALLLGLGVRPALPDPVSLAVEPAAARQAIGRMARDLAALVRASASAPARAGGRR